MCGYIPFVYATLENEASFNFTVFILIDLLLINQPREDDLYRVARSFMIEHKE